MNKRTFSMITLLAASAIALAVAGCKPEADKAGEPGAADKPAGAEQAAKPIEPDTMAFLCDKLAAESKAAAGKAFTEKVEKETRDNCRLMGMSFEKSSRAKEAIAAMVNHTIKACAGKSGKDWVDCYNNDMLEAGSAANKALMGK